MTSDRLVALGTFLNAFDADAAVVVIEAAGIEVVEKTDDGGTRIVVHASDAEHALDLIRWASTAACGDTAE